MEKWSNLRLIPSGALGHWGPALYPIIRKPQLLAAPGGKSKPPRHFQVKMSGAFLPGQVLRREQLRAVGSPCAGGPGQGTGSIYLQREGRAVAEAHDVFRAGEIGHATSGKERAEQFF